MYSSIMNMRQHNKYLEQMDPPTALAFPKLRPPTLYSLTFSGSLQEFPDTLVTIITCFPPAVSRWRNGY